jgi:hypothetical protein
MQYRLRTLLIALALGPPMIAAAWFVAFDLSAQDRAIFVGLLVSGAIAVALFSGVQLTIAAIHRK